MEQRKIILFGKSAFCITLPQAWIRKNKLKKGDSVGVQETLRNSLEVIPNINSSEVTTTEIDITEKSTEEIMPLLLATYLNGYSVIILTGTNSGKVTQIRDYVHSLIAAEIMEVTSNKIIINILWDITNINLHFIISRIDNIIISLFNETTDLLNSESNINDIIEKGYEVQRQVLLARRAITYALNNSSTAQKFNLSPLELYYISYMIYFFGKIGEYIVEISRIIASSKKNEEKNSENLSISNKSELKLMLTKTRKYYEKIVNLYDMQNKKENEKIEKIYFNEYADFENEITDFSTRSFKSKLPIIPEYIRMIVTKIKESELVIINMETSPK